METFKKDSAEMFEATLSIVESKKFADSEATSQLLIKSMLAFAENEEHKKKVHEWF
jgi:hypothetical protein